ncbi:acyl-CoA dehydrogenase family protein [Pararhizobium sp. YC-54]|uniref:acyl-CoA dehydrogenase family protein n=1 Tax=Pararhizobium sp. YC-54 TaxID=2986920 RepID=UPI0021F77EB5|nr:acyl-CoA dehydrogenase family protein [Pararhizobium sp. YC-54]MCW0001573.1 acyl-CoA dehydrogenase family protein [Pararhizobium sp. YC-54]
MRLLPSANEEHALREKVLKFCRDNIPETVVGLERQGTMSDGDSRAFYRRLGEAGWIGRHWPKQYGGQGGTHLDTAIVDEALGYARAPLSGYLLSVKVFGNSLLLFGTEAQKNFYLKEITAGRAIFCQGFSEPTAGSDFGALRTSARRDGDSFVVNGHKIWTSSAEVADYMYLAARTDPDAPKHRGISLFVLDMKSPGVTVNSFGTVGGGVLNEVFLDNVRVPAESLIGELNRGFHQSMRSLDLERSCMDRVGAAAFALDSLNSYVHETRPTNGDRLADVVAVQEKIAELYARLHLARCFGFQIARRLDAGSGASSEFSFGKLYVGLLTQAIADAATDIIGPRAQYEFGAELAVQEGRQAALYRASAALTLAGGSSEIQRTVIAVRGMGLPR